MTTHQSGNAAVPKAGLLAQDERLDAAAGRSQQYSFMRFALGTGLKPASQ
jgi:hypothetical protein